MPLTLPSRPNTWNIAARVLELIIEAKTRGITARELTKAFPGKDAVAFVPSLKALLRARKVRQEWTACADWREHSAVQEGRYFYITQTLKLG